MKQHWEKSREIFSGKFCLPKTFPWEKIKMGKFWGKYKKNPTIFPPSEVRVQIKPVYLYLLKSLCYCVTNIELTHFTTNI